MPSSPEPKQPKPTAAHKRLEVFIGTWHAEGTSYGDGQDATNPRASVDGQVWTFAEAQTRATVTVQGGGDKMTFSWEWKNGGRKWRPLCDRVAVRAQ